MACVIFLHAAHLLHNTTPEPSPVMDFVHSFISALVSERNDDGWVQSSTDYEVSNPSHSGFLQATFLLRSAKHIDTKQVGMIAIHVRSHFL